MPRTVARTPRAGTAMNYVDSVEVNVARHEEERDGTNG